MASRVRLFVNQPLGQGQSVPLSREHAHYLFGVMRLTVGVDVTLFNGTDGTWRATIVEAGKRAGILTCVELEQAQTAAPDVWLLFAPIKKARTDFIVEKAVEMGAARIVPVLTDFTNSERVRGDRLQAHAVEAAEQCGINYVPEVAEARKLSKVLDQWDSDRKLLFCDETLLSQTSTWSNLGDAQSWAILIGPEGGFSETERTRLQSFDASHPISLGPRILRADTAAVAALTLWQKTLGDWT
ncbi:MAG: 16S rRNA (uracil(1498)-N(3))-methyltransferase [Paracoccaceae bacterium]